MGREFDDGDHSNPGRPRSPGPRPPPAPPSWPSGRTPAASSRPWSSPPPSRCATACGAALAPTAPRLRRDGRRPTDPVEHRPPSGP